MPGCGTHGRAWRNPGMGTRESDGTLGRGSCVIWDPVAVIGCPTVETVHGRPLTVGPTGTTKTGQVGVGSADADRVLNVGEIVQVIRLGHMRYPDSRSGDRRQR